LKSMEGQNLTKRRETDLWSQIQRVVTDVYGGAKVLLSDLGVDPGLVGKLLSGAIMLL
jgi:hypothetical protein